MNTYSFDWSDFSSQDFFKLRKTVRENREFDANDLYGKVYVGDIAIDVINHPEIQSVFFDLYVLGEDTGYGETTDGIPYDYADGISVTYDEIMLFDYRDVKAMVEERVCEHINSHKVPNSLYDLSEHALRELKKW